MSVETKSVNDAVSECPRERIETAYALDRNPRRKGSTWRSAGPMEAKAPMRMPL